MGLGRRDVRLIGWSAVFAASQANIVRLLGPAGPHVLEVQTAWSADRYRQILDSMDTIMTARFRSHYYPDMVHPALYALALRAGAARLGELTELDPRTARILATAPVISAAGDYIENVVGLHLLDHPEHITDKVVRTTTVVSVSKWVLALGCLAYLSAGFTGVWSRALRR
ncbi:hypothetical protein DK926_19810 [Rhodococcus sp. Eu-32]|uniref:hypothetical protein n=1 Tax=Rhodococcus sp. Eu-32 TaxID=1017319 RepID=UPI000DF2D502|nr:hypothetical protein [Rhodococcus sp. Eu-32]RRQ26034.1 hypothetical protein DK926_19810 [Rhodococcus sp. Eu-32]